MTIESSANENSFNRVTTYATKFLNIIKNRYSFLKNIKDLME